MEWPAMGECSTDGQSLDARIHPPRQPHPWRPNLAEPVLSLSLAREVPSPHPPPGAPLCERLSASPPCATRHLGMVGWQELKLDWHNPPVQQQARLVIIGREPTRRIPDFMPQPTRQQVPPRGDLAAGGQASLASPPLGRPNGFRRRSVPSGGGPV